MITISNLVNLVSASSLFGVLGPDTQLVTRNEYQKSAPLKQAAELWKKGRKGIQARSCLTRLREWAVEYKYATLCPHNTKHNPQLMTKIWKKRWFKATVCGAATGVLAWVSGGTVPLAMSIFSGIVTANAAAAAASSRGEEPTYTVSVTVPLTPATPAHSRAVPTEPIQAPVPSQSHLVNEVNTPGAPVSASAPRGIRNNNPGNLRHGPSWQGLTQVQTDPDFAQFDTPENGLRALARTLHTYQTDHHLQTVEEIINRWAPSSENATPSYVQHVARYMNVGPRQQIQDFGNNEQTQALIQAIIVHENGRNPYSNEQIANGIQRALQ